MNLEEYIRQSYTRPNKQVLESLGASEGLVEYLLKTPWNTNLSIIDSISESGEEEEVIFYYSEFPEDYSEEYQSRLLKTEVFFAEWPNYGADFFGEVNELKFKIAIEVTWDVETGEYSITSIKDGIYESTEEEIPEDVMQKIERKVRDFPPRFIKESIGEPQE